MHSPSAEPRASVFYNYKIHPYRHSPDMDCGRAGAPVVIVGAGPIGLATAIDLARFGVASIVLERGPAGLSRQPRHRAHAPIDGNPPAVGRRRSVPRKRTAMGVRPLVLSGQGGLPHGHAARRG